MKISHPFLQVIGLGVLAGMRAASAPAITSHILSHHQSKKLAGTLLSFMQSYKVASGLKVFAVIEFIGDKLPGTPNRTELSALIARCLSGSLAGASIFKANGYNAFAGALIGSAAALGSTYGSFVLRKGIVSKTHVFDPIVGAIEDVLVISAGITLVAEA